MLAVRTSSRSSSRDFSTPQRPIHACWTRPSCRKWLGRSSSCRQGRRVASQLQSKKSWKNKVVRVQLRARHSSLSILEAFQPFTFLIKVLGAERRVGKRKSPGAEQKKRSRKAGALWEFRRPPRGVQRAPPLSRNYVDWCNMSREKCFVTPLESFSKGVFDPY